MEFEGSFGVAQRYVVQALCASPDGACELEASGSEKCNKNSDVGSRGEAREDEGMEGVTSQIRVVQRSALQGGSGQ